MDIRRIICGTVLGAAAVTASAASAQEVNVYSLRQPFLVEPLFESFTKETGVKVNVIFAEKGLVERIKQEGANSPADVLMTVDISRIKEAVDAGVTDAVNSDVLEANIPAHLRDENDQWFALTQRGRALYASKDRVTEGEIATYEDLADPKWKGRVCTRSGTHDYNIALVSSMIAHHGTEEAKTWLEGLKANLARKPQGNDRGQVKAIKEGECDVAIANTYYYGKMLDDPEQRAWAESVNIIFPNQNDRGMSMNISGMTLIKGAPNKENAVKLMEFLSGDEAQKIYAEVNYEYPVKPGVEWSDYVKSWGTFKADELPLSEIARLRADAVRMIDEVGYNE
ncbi:iron(III) transport system substrate-binding protein [Thalassospira sp. MBR-102]|jgi:iron(III) transport system substrate-binding protein|uniref:Iron ABC transporter substrate-binding protein n=1 Tax=Thalassospira permensis NBRC 106175 TaxID=1353532 RepID=A0ABR4TR18_9PROT|nr:MULTISPECIES: Fe(3+) ABC transporter substrate-binding protein [Thalassospira]KEO58156.1 iron ABC transporter substrate-binding protein [Thalassospira permensis NBRC 106175]MAB34272.1 iron ABC transporter substrate-binding protein [Thalassospira sp.]MAL30743.1 iron ABC transporter substrate-binding protein [Thalassospira sp.]MBA05296.1 iron ABC transporter substrate-binding protein [Thalassospira sp.]MBL4842488.1 Fe(3+) ABC transporter substrate-binding protein [Thalassospira sp.]|tara:strand:- start:61 stop:1077 length:1017 start_codon:yes stop_codon:yes gene_type:complete